MSFTEKKTHTAIPAQAKGSHKLSILFDVCTIQTQSLSYIPIVFGVSPFFYTVHQRYIIIKYLFRQLLWNFIILFKYHLQQLSIFSFSYYFVHCVLWVFYSSCIFMTWAFVSLQPLSHSLYVTFNLCACEMRRAAHFTKIGFTIYFLRVDLNKNTHKFPSYSTYIHANV